MIGEAETVFPARYRDSWDSVVAGEQVVARVTMLSFRSFEVRLMICFTGTLTKIVQLFSLRATGQRTAK